MVGGGLGPTPSTWNLGSNWPRWSEIADFQSIFVRSASAVTFSKNSSINTTRFLTSLRRTSYLASMPQGGGLKNAKRPFPYKIALRLKKVCYKISLCEKRQWQSCEAFIGPYREHPYINDWWETSPLTRKFGGQWPTPFRNVDFQSIFVRSASAVTLSKKVQLTLIGSLLRAFQWVQGEHRTFPLAPTKGAQIRKVSKIWRISCDNSETVRDRMSVRPSINH